MNIQLNLTLTWRKCGTQKMPNKTKLKNNQIEINVQWMAQFSTIMVSVCVCMKMYSCLLKNISWCRYRAKLNKLCECTLVMLLQFCSIFFIELTLCFRNASLSVNCKLCKCADAYHQNVDVQHQFQPYWCTSNVNMQLN